MLWWGGHYYMRSIRAAVLGGSRITHSDWQHKSLIFALIVDYSLNNAFIPQDFIIQINSEYSCFLGEENEA